MIPISSISARRKSHPHLVRCLLFSALVLVTARVGAAHPPGDLTDLDERFRTLLRERIAEATPLEQDRLLNIAEETARDVFGTDRGRLRAAAQAELSALPRPPEALLSYCPPDDGVSESHRPVSITLPKQPLWVRPWSPERTAEMALALHKAETLPPQAMAIDALLRKIAEPRIYRAGDDWLSPVLVIQELLDCYRIRLEMDEASSNYTEATLERFSASNP